MEGSLPLVSRLDADIVEAPVNVKLGEVLGSAELRDKLEDQGERIFILNHHGIKGSITLDQSEGTVFLLDEEHQSGYRGFRGSNTSCVQVGSSQGRYLASFAPLERGGTPWMTSAPIWVCVAGIGDQGLEGVQIVFHHLIALVVGGPF